MDKNSFIGIVLGLTAILGGQALEGGHLQSLLQITAFVIVIGGTLAALLVQTTVPNFMAGLRIAKWVFIPPTVNLDALSKSIVNWSQNARRGGLLALEGPMQSEKDQFIKRGLQLLVDGAEPEMIRHALELDIDNYEDRLRSAAKIWESAGGYSPTIGIIGAVMGLIHVMENLSDPAKLGGGIAVAFVATIYGVGTANLIFLPMANKLKSHITSEIRRRELLVEGLVSIANGENPRIIESKLKSFLA